VLRPTLAVVLRLPRLSPRAYGRITLLVLFAVGFIIVTGASVRLTGSGLGCSEWPTCEKGQLVAELEAHQMIEFGNRLITGVVSVAVILAVLGSLVRDPRRRDLTWWSLGLVAGIMAQAVLGGISVKMELAPAFISAHFLLSIVLVWNAMVLHNRANQPEGHPVAAVGPFEVRTGRLLVALACLVLVTGTLVTGTGPHSGDERSHRYDFASIADVVRVHSSTVWVFLAVALFLVWRLTRTGSRDIEQRARLLVAAIIFQGALGYAQYASGVPPYLVIVHVLGSVLVFIATLHLYFGLFVVPVTERGSTPITFADPPVGAAAPVATGATGEREPSGAV
jgi:cytochrome c oxidase assembly protein subunit 15